MHRQSQSHVLMTDDQTHHDCIIFDTALHKLIQNITENQFYDQNALGLEPQSPTIQKLHRLDDPLTDRPNGTLQRRRMLMVVESGGDPFRVLCNFFFIHPFNRYSKV